ncbi:MAG TPA: CopG family transcriptional regulator [Agromyces sp.]|nr:CopG family transcriptional regulator [Agromyces sp.]
MELAISMPDAAGERAQRAAEIAGMTFSEFMTRAADEYAKKLRAESTTQVINAALDSIGNDTNSRVAVEAGIATVGRSEW